MGNTHKAKPVLATSIPCYNEEEILKKTYTELNNCYIVVLGFLLISVLRSVK